MCACLCTPVHTLSVGAWCSSSPPVSLGIFQGFGFPQRSSAHSVGLLFPSSSRDPERDTAAVAPILPAGSPPCPHDPNLSTGLGLTSFASDIAVAPASPTALSLTRNGRIPAPCAQTCFSLQQGPPRGNIFIMLSAILHHGELPGWCRRGGEHSWRCCRLAPGTAGRNLCLSTLPLSTLNRLSRCPCCLQAAREAGAQPLTPARQLQRSRLLARCHPQDESPGQHPHQPWC